MKSKKKSLASLIPLISGVWLSEPGMATEESFTLEEVIVTATKRAESANDIGIAINAFSSDQINKLGLEKPEDLQSQVPNLTIKNTGGNSLPIFTIRGVGATEWSINNLPAVGVYIDEVMYPNPLSLSFSLLDFDQIEVLKGPQGYLFGRNSTGGAVSFTTKRPTEELEGYLTADIGNYAKKHIKGAISGGLSDTLAGRLAFSIERQDEGWWDSKALNIDHGEIDRVSVRTALNWNPTDELNVYANMFYGSDKSDTAQTWGISRLGCDIDNLEQAADRGCVDLLGLSGGDDPYEYVSQWEPEMDTEAWGFNINIGYEVGGYTLSTVTGYHTADHYKEAESAGRLSQIQFDVHDMNASAFSQEVRLASSAEEQLRWMIGAYYSIDKTDGSMDFLFKDHPNYLSDIINTWDQESKSYSAFTHIEYDISDEVTLTFGARIAKDKREFDGATEVIDTYGTLANSNFYWYWGPQNIDYPTPGTLDASRNLFTPDGGFRMEGKDLEISYSEWAGKVGVEWRPYDDTLLYASISRGFNSGGFLGALAFYAEDYTPFDQEIITSYEIGTKLTLLEDTMQLNAAVFYYEYEDIQKQVVHPVTFIGSIENAGDARMSGLDMDITWLPINGLTLRTGVGYTHSEMTTMSVASSIDFTGNRLGNQPFWTVTGLARYERSLTEALDMAFQVDGRWQDKQYLALSNLPEVTWPSYSVVNVSASLLSADDKWDVTAYMKNVADEVYATFGLRQSLGNTFVVPGAPRVYGIRGTYRF